MRTINICVINIISQNLEKFTYLIYVLHIYGSLLLGENVHRIAHSTERSRTATMWLLGVSVSAIVLFDVPINGRGAFPHRRSSVKKLKWKNKCYVYVSNSL